MKRGRKHPAVTAWRPSLLQAIRNIIDFIRTKLSGLTSASKLLVGALVVIIAMTFFLVAQYSSTKSMVVFEVLPTGRDEAKRFLGERAVVYEETGGQILVPVEQHAALVSGFTEAHGGASDLLDFNKLFESDNPFETGRRSEDKKHFALQNVLSRTITGFKGVKSATVVISQKPALTFGASRPVQTAMVNVVMKSGELSQDQVEAIAAMVAGTQSGLKPESVSVTDQARRYKVSRSGSNATGENLEYSLKVAEAVHTRIAALLANIPGVFISVNPQVVTTAVTRTKTEYGEGIAMPLSESSSSTASQGAVAGREPGVVPNTGISVGNSAGGGSHQSTERSDNRYLPAVPSTQETSIDPTGYAAKIDVGVALPYTYFRGVWKLKNPTATAEPDEAALAIIRDEEILKLRKLLETQITTDAYEKSKKGVVEVSWYYDVNTVIGTGVEPTATAGLGIAEIVSSDGIGGTLIKPALLGLLAVGSLLFMFNMVKKAAVPEQLPSAGELAGIPPALEGDDADIVGEADEATPALEGMELDDESLRRQQMLKQLNDIANHDATDLAGILKRWMRTSA
ncbi:MAG: hypothetical protein DWI11_01225 [Planctomycetota bacterium]|nr:MAG: hypothetical protein DWI11_01225 [Planctomycetota bacterium]